MDGRTDGRTDGDIGRVDEWAGVGLITARYRMLMHDTFIYIVISNRNFA